MDEWTENELKKEMAKGRLHENSRYLIHVHQILLDLRLQHETLESIFTLLSRIPVKGREQEVFSFIERLEQILTNVRLSGEHSMLIIYLIRQIREKL